MQTIDKVIGIVKHMPWSQVVKELDSIKDEEWEAVRTVTADYCYDRGVCKELGVDYSNLDKQAVRRIELVAYYMVKSGGKKNE